ncbi:uncharacterized protein G2W53_017919 [Senna tora]|uniref:Uncharacterized protein n=1 Tax=Senna tora TaxID=362788 RepID=A0A834TR32_9FABA|nr:uncharacterized protein G2W53_017919 [Senna tora]
MDASTSPTMSLHFHEASPKPPYKRSDEALHLPSKKTPTSSPTSNHPRRKLSKTSNSNLHPPLRFRIPPPFHEGSRCPTNRQVSLPGSLKFQGSRCLANP